MLYEVPTYVPEDPSLRHLAMHRHSIPELGNTALHFMLTAERERSYVYLLFVVIVPTIVLNTVRVQYSHLLIEWQNLIRVSCSQDCEAYE